MSNLLRDSILNAVRAGRITTSHAARKLGVSRQAVSQSVRNARNRSKPLPPPKPAPVSSDVAWEMCRLTEREYHAPRLLLSILEGRLDSSARLLLEGLHLHYLECVTMGRLDVWAKAAHAAVDLMACAPEAEIMPHPDAPGQRT